MSASVIFPFLLGILAALGVNYLSDVLPSTLHLTRPLCSNPDCQKPFAWKDYLLMLPCKTCGKRRSIRTFVILALCILSSVYIWLKPIPFHWQLAVTPRHILSYVLSYIVLNYLLTVAVIDLEHRLILRPLSIAGLVIATAAGILMHNWLSTLLGGLMGFGIMFLFYLGGKAFSKRRGQTEEALGSGDVTLATILGLLLGWLYTWFGLLAGALIAGVVSIVILVVLAIQRKYKGQAFSVFIPLGPMFILSAILIIFLPQFVSFFLPK